MRVLAALLLLLGGSSASKAIREQVYDPFVTDLKPFGSASAQSTDANDPDLLALLANMVRTIMTSEL